MKVKGTKNKITVAGNLIFDDAVLEILKLSGLAKTFPPEV
jgi:hypothetical protein